MTSVFKAFLLLALLAMAPATAHAADTTDPRMADRVLGNANAPVKVDEYISLTCSHCAEFYTTVLPTLQTKYIDTGKVKFVMHDFPLDGVGLKAAGLARCMPPDEFFPFIEVLYKNQAAWVLNPNVDTILVQYASLGGLSPDKAKACLLDRDLQDKVAAERTAAGKYNIDATPTFILNDGADTIKGAQTVETFSAALDQLLKTKK